MNREFGAFLMSNLGRRVMTENKLSIHVESGYIFYENHNTGKNFYNFLLAQQNDDAAFIPKNFLITEALKAILVSFCRRFLKMTQKNTIYLLIKTQNIYFIVLATISKPMEIQDIKLSILEKC